MRLLQILSPTAAAGKTVWTVGLVRALRERGLRVTAFKPMSEDEVGYEVEKGRVSLSALHLSAAAGRQPCGLMNPVLILPNQNNMAQIWLLGRHIGEVARLGRDTALLDDLDPLQREEIEHTVLTCLEQTAKDADIVVAEGSGAATDLSLLGAWDLANVIVPSRADAIILVSRASQGGALANMQGTVVSLGEDLLALLRGLALNDVRHRLQDLTQAAELVAAKLRIIFLGATPWLSFFDGRGQFAPYTPESDEDHRVIGEALRDSIRIPEILRWMKLTDI